jgi:hypothetical protein
VKTDRGRGNRVLPGELRIAVVRAAEHEQALQRLGRRVGDVGRRPADLLEPDERRGRLDHLELRHPADRPHHLDPPVVLPGRDAVDLVERVVAVLLIPEHAGLRIHGHPEAVADTVGEDLLDVRADLPADAAT